jgi:hypothetical protein
MGIEDVRAAFFFGSGSALRLRDARLKHDAGQQILEFAGWYADGTDFAYRSQPFTGDVGERAREIAQELLQQRLLQQKGQPMSAPVILGLAETLRSLPDRVNALVTQAKDKVEGSLKNLETVVAQAHIAANQIDDAAAQVQGALGLSSNGGPPLHDAPLADAQQPQK